MIKDPNWDRWIYTNIVLHFSQISQDNNINFYLNTIDQNLRVNDWVELRYGGPYIEEPSKGCYIITVNIDILITCYVGPDSYKIRRMSGIFANAFTPICVYKYGDGEDDDHSFLGELRITDDDIKTTNYGVIFPANNYERTSVESDYRMYLR